MTTSVGPVTADDLAAAVTACVAALRVGSDADWSRPAGGLEWGCWETVEHLADDLFAYAVQLGPVRGSGYLPVEATGRHPAGPVNTIRADPAAGPAGLLDVLAACGWLLVAAVRAAPAGRRAHHVFGPADAEASAAMGVLEAVVHTHDLTQGLGLGWAPDQGVCVRVLARLMPAVDPGDDPWEALLRATGRRGDIGPWRWWN